MKEWHRRRIEKRERLKAERDHMLERQATLLSSSPEPPPAGVRMKGVVDSIIVRSVGDRTWELMEPFEWYGIIVPAGFITDFASIPRPFWSFINPAGRVKPASIPHDFLYSRQGKLDHTTLTRKRCDQIFLEIMVVIKMKWIKRHLAYRAVRIFGWISWNRREK